MTSVNISTINNTTVISIAGHAEHSFDHNDIVCASISTLSQSLLNTLKMYEDDGVCKILSEDTNADIGSMLISFISANKDITDALINMASIGFLMLEKAYPKNIFTNIE